MVADSIKALWTTGALFSNTDSMSNQMQLQLPQFRLDSAALPDSVRPVTAMAGTSCKTTPTPQALMQMVQAQMTAPRPVIGVQFQPLIARDTAGLGLPNMRGLLVQSVTPGYGAAAAGIVKGDVIIALNGQSASLNRFLKQAVTWKEGQVVNVEVVHQGGKHQKVDIATKMSK